MAHRFFLFLQGRLAQKRGFSVLSTNSTVFRSGHFSFLSIAIVIAIAIAIALALALAMVSFAIPRFDSLLTTPSILPSSLINTSISCLAHGAFSGYKKAASAHVVSAHASQIPFVVLFHVSFAVPHVPENSTSPAQKVTTNSESGIHQTR